MIGCAIAMILVVAEQQRGKLHRASWEAIAAAQELAGDQPVEAIVLGAEPADAASELEPGGRDHGPRRRFAAARAVHAGRVHRRASKSDRRS